MAGILYIVATPIGNLKDISYRAVETLKNADIIACEDTRHSLTLLNEYRINKPLTSYHKFNEAAAAKKITDKVKEGKNVAVITDAGTPVISDPGNLLVKEAVKEGIKYTVIPGAAAFVNALVLSGFDASRFVFAGFLPQKNSQRQQLLKKLAGYDCTLIFYSAPHDVAKDIEVLYKALGERNFAAVAEITKLHERVLFGKLSEGLPEQPKGEYTLIVEGAAQTENPLNSLSVEDLARWTR
jgi:16S rRNA (cytidine1402-2'-O)-methyltransferase